MTALISSSFCILKREVRGWGWGFLCEDNLLLIIKNILGDIYMRIFGKSLRFLSN